MVQRQGVREITSSLVEEINKLEGIDSLQFKPEIYTEEVGTEIVKMFSENTLIPTLMFVNPWGYKGLSLKLINSVLKDWACECLFFFNYNRINAGLSNPAVKAQHRSLCSAKNVPHNSHRYSSRWLHRSES